MIAYPAPRSDASLYNWTGFTKSHLFISTVTLHFFFKISNKSCSIFPQINSVFPVNRDSGALISEKLPTYRRVILITLKNFRTGLASLGTEDFRILSHFSGFVTTFPPALWSTPSAKVSSTNSSNFLKVRFSFTQINRGNSSSLSMEYSPIKHSNPEKMSSI